MSVIVTLTSTSERIQILQYTLMSLLAQDCKPDRIVVFLSREPYLMDRGIKKIPSWLDRMISEKKVELEWVENTGPYRKLIPVYARASNEDWIITCDDDVIYGSQWLSSLIKAGNKYPKAIVCGRARRPVMNLWKKRQSYINWPLVPPDTNGKNLLPIGIAGVLYRKPLLDERIMFSNDYKKLAPKQDDLWFNLARQVAGTNVYVAPEVDDNVYPIDAPAPLSKTNATTQVTGWDNFIKALYERVYVRVKGFLGAAVCENDVAIKKLDEYEKRLRSESLF